MPTAEAVQAQILAHQARNAETTAKTEVPVLSLPKTSSALIRLHLT